MISRRQAAEQTDEIKRLKAANGNAVASEHRTIAIRCRCIKRRSSRRDAELAAAQTNLQQLQAKADTLSQQREDTAKQRSGARSESG